MPTEIVHDRYGKTAVRLMKVDRTGTSHVVRELSVDVTLEGEFAEAYTGGDNTRVLPTDTMKNTVYVLARRHPLDTIESYAAELAGHFVSRNEPVSTAVVEVESVTWRHADAGGGPLATTFIRGGEERETARARHGGGAAAVSAGLRGLRILKTAHSGFSNFLRDEYTTLGDTDDRLLGTSLVAQWDYAAGTGGFADERTAVQSALIEAFDAHRSLSVQHTLYAMAERALEACPAVERISLSMPNKHCLLVDLSPFGLDNDNEVFLPIDEPSGLIEATLRRSGSP